MSFFLWLRLSPLIRAASFIRSFSLEMKFRYAITDIGMLALFPITSSSIGTLGTAEHSAARTRRATENEIRKQERQRCGRWYGTLSIQQSAVSAKDVESNRAPAQHNEPL